MILVTVDFMSGKLIYVKFYNPWKLITRSIISFRKSGLTRISSNFTWQYV